VRVTLLLLVFLQVASGAGADTRAEGRPEAPVRLLADDLTAVRVYREGLRSLLDFVDATPEVFRPQGGPGVPRPWARDALRETWAAYLDYHLALDSVREAYRGFGDLPGDERAPSFAVLYAAFLAQYRSALALLAALDGHPSADTLLNEPLSELGLPERTFARFKFRYLNAGRATEFAALTVVDVALGSPRPEPVGPGMGEDGAAIWGMGKGRGEALTVKNAFRVLGDAGFRAWLPVQAGLSQWMGDVKVWRPGQTLISPTAAGALAGRLRPGDVLLERREWYLSNVGLPGFWTHAALYVGTPEERRAWLGTEEVRAWVRGQGREDGDLEGLLAQRYPEAYAGSRAAQEDGHPPRVLEAVGEGVVFTTLEHSGAADSLAVLRPRLPPPEVAGALARAFGYAGRPYDFNFDFVSDAALVCSELVYKAYEPGPGRGVRGLRLPLVTVAGRLLTPPNELARLFDREHGSPEAQFELVLFLDGFERQGTALEAGDAAFRESWRRPKWHVLVQGTPGGE